MSRLPPETLARLRLRVAIAAVIPFVIAVVTTLVEAWPATIVIGQLADASGRYGLRAAIVGTFALLGVAELAVLVPAAIVVSALRRRPR